MDIDDLKEEWNNSRYRKASFDDTFSKGNHYVTNFHSLKNFLMKNKYFKYECSTCKISEWNNTVIILQMDHIDGDKQNNDLSNLRLICPNCHSQTSTFSTKKSKNVKPMVNEESIIKTIKESYNIRDVLLKLKLQPHGANYPRIQRILYQNKDLCFLSKPEKEIKIITPKEFRSYRSYRSKLCLTEGCNTNISGQGESGLCIDCYMKSVRKVERPSKDEMVSLLENKSILQIAYKYGVSDAAIRKWLISYDLPYKKKDIKIFLKEIGKDYNVKWQWSQELMDKVRKERQGINSTNAKLNEQHVREIRIKAKEGISRTQLATMYNISRGVINAVVMKRAWKHVV